VSIRWPALAEASEYGELGKPVRQQLANTKGALFLLGGTGAVVDMIIADSFAGPAMPYILAAELLIGLSFYVAELVLGEPDRCFDGQEDALLDALKHEFGTSWDQDGKAEFDDCRTWVAFQDASRSVKLIAENIAERAAKRDEVEKWLSKRCTAGR
jgi:hypothetical protein